MHMGSSKPKETHFGKNEIKRRRSAKKVNKIEPKKKTKNLQAHSILPNNIRTLTKSKSHQ